MIHTLQSSTMSGLYTHFEIEDTLTGVVRSYTQAPNKLTEQGLAKFGNDDPKWHRFNRCLLSRQVLSSGDVSWGEVIPTNSNPDDPLCSMFVASEENVAYHGDFVKIDDGTVLAFEGIKSWTFRQGISGTFHMVISGHMESTTDVPDGVSVLRPPEELLTRCPLTGLEDYSNWKLFPISVAMLPEDVNGPTVLTLQPTDILTVTHRLRLTLPKYVPGLLLDDVTIGNQVYSFYAKPYLPAYDALVPTNIPMTRMSYCNSSEMTDGLVAGIRQSITDGDLDTEGTAFVIGEGDYSSSLQGKTIIDGEDVDIPVMQHTLTLKPEDGHGRIGYLLINGCGAWYEVEITPPIVKRNIDKLSLTFNFYWG